MRAASEPRPDLLVSPPLAARRLRQRGFDQALEIAKRVGSELRIDVRWKGLSRFGDTLPQPGLGREARRRNLRDAFRCGLDLRDQHVAVVDDVMTTGATAEALARVLKQAGAARVSVWVVARTPDPRRD